VLPNGLDLHSAVEEHLPLVSAIAADFAVAAAIAHLPWEDVLGAGALGLTQAVRRWNPTKGPFGAFAPKWIRGQIRTDLRLSRPWRTGHDMTQVRDHRPPPVPGLEPLFPCTAFTPASVCPHHQPIANGSVFFCSVCHQSGYDWHPALKLSPADLQRPKTPRRSGPPPIPQVERRRRMRQFERREP
jgi:hypothetical protein